MAERVEIVEMGPRDGLQNEARRIATTDKIALVDLPEPCRFRAHRGDEFRQPEMGAADWPMRPRCMAGNQPGAGCRLHGADAEPQGLPGGAGGGGG